MTDAGAGRQAQRPRFPKTLGDLTDPSKCPSCFETYGAPGTSCAHCGFTRDRAVISHLLELGAQARGPLLARGEFIVTTNERARAEVTTALSAEQNRRQQDLREQQQDNEALLAADHARLLDGAAGHLGADTAPTPEQVPAPTQRAAPRGPQQPQAHAQPVVPPQSPVNRWPAQQAPAGRQAPPARPLPPIQPPQPSGPRRSSVQLLLLVLGIGLLSVAAIVFLTFAWVVFGVEVKAAITAGVTLAVIATAGALKRRKLSATAEGVAALGIVLLVLDVWAVQATGLFGADRAPGTLYWGAGLLAAAAAFEVWHRLARLRTPGIAASLTILPAIALSVAGATSTVLTPVQRLVLALVLAGAASALHVLLRVERPARLAPRVSNTTDSFSGATPRSLERWILAVTGAIALAGGVLAGSSAAAGNEPWLGYAFLFALAAASSALLAWLISQEQGALGSRTLLVAFGVLTALALGVVPLGFAAPTRLALSLAVIPISLAAAQVLRRRLASDAPRRGVSLQVSVTAWTITTLAVAIVPIVALVLDVMPSGYFLSLIAADQAGMADSFDGLDSGAWWAIASAAIGLAVAAALLQLEPLLLRQLTSAFVASGSFLALCAAAGTPGPLSASASNLALASTGALAAGAITRSRAAQANRADASAPGITGVVQSATGAAILALMSSGLAVRPLEILALVCAAALTFCLRFSTGARSTTLRPALTVTTALLLLSVPLLTAFVRQGWNAAEAPATNLTVTVSYLGVAVLLAVAALLTPGHWLVDSERTLLAYAAAVPAAVASFVYVGLIIASSARTGSGDLLTVADWPFWALWISGAAAGALLSGTLTLAALRHGNLPRATTLPLLAVLPPTVWGALSALAALFTPVPQLGAVSASLGIGAAALVAGATLIARVRGAAHSRVLPTELAAVAVMMVSLAITPLFTGPLGYPGSPQYFAATLAVSSSVAVLLATTESGPFAAPRRAWIAWVGVAGLTWSWFLTARVTPGIDTAEAFWMPAGIPLVAAALMLWRLGATRRSRRTTRAAALVLAGGLILSTLVPALTAAQSTGTIFLYAAIGAGFSLAAAWAAAALRPEAQARPLLISLACSGGAIAVLTVMSHLALDLGGPSPRTTTLLDLTPAAEALCWLAACILLTGTVARLLLRPVWEANEQDSRRKLLLSILLSFFVAVIIAIHLSTRFDGTVLLIGLAFLSQIVGASLPTRLITPRGRASIALVSLVALVPHESALVLRNSVRAILISDIEAWLVSAMLAGVVASAALTVLRLLTEASALTRLPSYASALLATWLLIRHTQILGLESTTPIQLAATAGTLGVLAALLGVLIAPSGSRRGDGVALRALGLAISLSGVILAPTTSFAARYEGWTPLPLAIALLAATMIVSSAQIGGRSPYAMLRYLGVPVLALAWVWEVLSNWDRTSIFVAFGGAFLVFFAAGVASSRLGRLDRLARAPGLEGLLWLAAAPGIWLSAGAVAAVAQPSDAAGPRLLSLSIPEFGLALLTLVIVIACAAAPVPAGMRASANALGVGASISAAVLGPALVLAAEGPLTSLALPVWGVLPACVVLLFGSALWRQQHQLENPRLAALSATVLVPTAIAAMVLSAFPSLLRDPVENNQQMALPWVAVLCALALAALKRPELLPTLDSAEAMPGARRSLRLPVLASSAAALIAMTGVIATQHPLRWLELATAPLAATLLAGGLYFLAQRPLLRSWAALSPGLVLLLVPSYLAQFADPAPWRVITLGLLAVGVAIWGATRRLQAPLVLGAIVTVLHAVTAFRQQLAVVAGVVPWWVWLALAGTVLVVIATTYEARLRDAKRAAASIRSLR